MTQALTIAVSKGRILDQALPLLAKSGVEIAEPDFEKTRKLILDTTRENCRVVIIRAADVPTFVDYGAADIGIAGKDVLMEYGGDGVYEPLDLRIATCRLMLAGLKGKRPQSTRLRVATKYVKSTRDYFAAQGRQVDIVKLYGSMELAPIVGLADYIVDLVDTGGTLSANGLEAFEEIAPISSRLIVNKGAMKMKHRAVKSFIEAMAAAVAAQND